MTELHKQESTIMQSLNKVGLQDLAWALRRFHLPVKTTDLVLEVGSGGNPYPRANVLLDAYEETQERHWAPLTTDRPTILGFVENLPFKDQSFDFVIAAHVLEHSKDPVRFLSELQRVARAGYIEVPDAFLERINPYKDHRLEISLRNNTLQIYKKHSWNHATDVIELYEDRVKQILPSKLIKKHPFEFHVRYYWNNQISYTVINPAVDISWSSPSNNESTLRRSLKNNLRENIRNSLRKFLSQRRRNASISLLPLLQCTECKGQNLTEHSEHLQCLACNTTFPIRKGVVVMNERN